MNRATDKRLRKLEGAEPARRQRVLYSAFPGWRAAAGADTAHRNVPWHCRARSGSTGPARRHARRAPEARLDPTNLDLVYWWSGDDAERVRAYAEELVSLAPDLIVALSPPVLAGTRPSSSWS
jgi:hypothetical protein